ncbi:MAG TPA: hypothetical protein VN495_03215 [Candidatus Paceibacterota bacterium]|nr:hypothetical protein [Candidatus Paceibacterota bacterium]
MHSQHNRREFCLGAFAMFFQPTSAPRLDLRVPRAMPICEALSATGRVTFRTMRINGTEAPYIVRFDDVSLPIADTKQFFAVECNGVFVEMPLSTEVPSGTRIVVETRTPWQKVDKMRQIG